MAVSVVPFVLPGCRLGGVESAPSELVVSASSQARSATCPACGHGSRRVHGRYTRSPADLPVSDRAVGLRLSVRRFRCLNAACPRQTFAEPFPGLVARHSRRTGRLAAAQVRVGLAVGAEPGGRLLAGLHMATSPDTVLRLLHRHPVPAAETPSTRGVDDWAWRKGRAWGTILVDLERRRPVDLLPDRAAASVSMWLRDHPGVEVVARDRSTEYARAIAEGAPEALQVADRWHLLHNLRQVLVRHLTSVRGRLKALPGGENLPADGLPPDVGRVRSRRPRRPLGTGTSPATPRSAGSTPKTGSTSSRSPVRSGSAVRPYGSISPPTPSPSGVATRCRRVSSPRTRSTSTLDGSRGRGARSDSGARSERSGMPGPRGRSRSGRRVAGRSLTRAHRGST